MQAWLSDPALWVPMLLALALLGFAALHDLAARIIPDWVSLALLPIGFWLRIWQGGALWALVALLLVFAAAVLVWRLGALGGGDVKLLSAATPLLPPSEVPTLLVAVALAGGALALLYLLLRPLLRGREAGARPRGLLARVGRIERWRIGRGGPLPYGIAIAAGAAWAMLGSSGF
ncbi:prepilin peptidase [Roseomonas hellenica]|uniref:Prepilin peptidase n=1 Tax=Plastoroseomonas hellenica TaxID=2687306 RepID=A0ABS5EVC4_9PROT|nr:A24 family peptidase [Plastoroseomonas hellenica]MBR0664244.1 prepilin peptidase [Plastoroseomonas hellenica]